MRRAFAACVLATTACTGSATESATPPNVEARASATADAVPPAGSTVFAQSVDIPLGRDGAFVWTSPARPEAGRRTLSALTLETRVEGGDATVTKKRAVLLPTGQARVTFDVSGRSGSPRLHIISLFAEARG